MVKILSSADIHLSNHLPHARPSTAGRTDRFDDQLALLDHMWEVAVEEAVDAIMLLGDIFDQSKVDAVTLTHSVERIVRAPVPTYILPGNHDAVSVRGGRFLVEAFGAMGRDHIHYLNSETPLEMKGVTFWPLAYMPGSETKAALARTRKARKAAARASQRDVLLFHNSVLGCTHIGWTCDDGLEAEEVCQDFDWVLSGHFHDTQTFGPNDRGMYLGAPMQHHYGDVGRPAGFWIFDFKDGKRTQKFIQSQTPQFYAYEELEDKVAAKAGDYVRYRIRATHADWAIAKPKVKALCSALELKGIRADFKHDPIYHHDSRMGAVGTKTKKAETMTMDQAIAKYVDTEGVALGSLDAARLKAIGREALAAVRSGRGSR